VRKTSLNECEKNICYIVDTINCQQIPIARRLSELGFVRGSKVKIIEFSALKKTLLTEIEGCVLSLRASVAALVIVNEMDKSKI
jgi:Fe2+ transport system protein FeoA